jgi:hypothetical protein
MNQPANRKQMIAFTDLPEHKRIGNERSIKVQPLQDLVKGIFELDRCWMRGETSNQWLFASRGLTIQMHQLTAFK